MRQPTSTSDPRSAWIPVLLFFSLTYASLIGLYWPTFVSLVTTWYSSVSYQHGFAILPICLYLVWKKRHLLASVRPEPTLWGLILLFPPALAWFIGDLVQVQVVKQVAVILLLQALTLVFLGVTVCRMLAFPLTYIFFAVPMGEDLIPFLQDYTAWFTVQALQWTGIPVYLEGRYLTIPTGTWHVAESCAGIRYIIPSLALGTLFAGLTYQSWSRRLLFVLAAALVPVIANGIRAYGIVMLAYLTDNALAVGVDHFIYGGVFFGLIMFGLFSIGLRWREPQREAPPSSAHRSSSSLTPSCAPSLGDPSIGQLAGLAILAVSVLATAPTLATTLTQLDSPSHDAMATIPDVSPPWRALPTYTGAWTPLVIGTPITMARSFENGSHHVHLHVALYERQRQGAEIVHDRHDFTDHEIWRLVSREARTIRLDGQQVDVSARTLRSTRTPQLVRVWTWYWVSGTFTTNPYYAKWLQLKGQLWGPAGAAVIGLATNYDELAPTVADRTLQDFLDHLQQPMRVTLQESFQPMK